MEFNTELVEKFLNGTASQTEAENVLEWFETQKGKRYLETRFDKDALDFGLPPETDNKNFWPGKPKNIKFQNSSQPKSLYKRTSVWVVAASVTFLIAVLSVLNIYTAKDQAGKKISSSFYSTSANEHRIITLTDGTRIRLNENAEIEISDFQNSDTRTVNLRGEAFFEVARNESKPFIVKSEYGIVKVLGTAFNVKTSGLSGNLLIVAVSEGKVSFRKNNYRLSEQEQILTKNQIGLLNTKTSELTTEGINVRNYLTWMHGRVVYEKTPFETVMKQLSHIYQIENKILDEKLNELVLTADFSERSLENVIETIAHSLNIQAKINGRKVEWSLK